MQRPDQLNQPFDDGDDGGVDDDDMDYGDDNCDDGDDGGNAGDHDDGDVDDDNDHQECSTQPNQPAPKAGIKRKCTLLQKFPDFVGIWKFSLPPLW